MSINTASSSNVTIGQKEWDATGTIVNRYPLNGVEGDLEDIQPALIPDMFEYWGITATNRISNVVEHGLHPQENKDAQPLGVPNLFHAAFEEAHQTPSPIVPQSPNSAAQEAVLPKSHLSLYWDIWRKVWDSHVESWINNWEDPAGETCGTPSDERNIITFDRTHKVSYTSHAAPAFTSRLDVPVGPSRQETGLPHGRNTPYRVIQTQHNAEPHHGNEGIIFMRSAYSVYYNSTLLRPPFGETGRQDILSENEEHAETQGSGFPPVEPTSTRSAGSL